MVVLAWIACGCEVFVEEDVVSGLSVGFRGLVSISQVSYQTAL
jgi:hypothetical protein